jgi:UDP-glucose 4-epimerase
MACPRLRNLFPYSTSEADYRDESVIRTILSRYQKKQHGNTLISSCDSLQLQSTITGVIHFAAYKAVAESFSKPLSYYGNNVSGVISFCTVLNEFNIKSLVFSSSATVYGTHANRGGRLPQELCVHDVEHPSTDSSGAQQVSTGGCSGLTNPYGRTKWICEAFLHDLAASDPDWNIVALHTSIQSDAMPAVYSAKTLAIHPTT